MFANLLRLKGSSRKLCLLNVNERDEKEKKVKNDSHEFLLAVGNKKMNLISSEKGCLCLRDCDEVHNDCLRYLKKISKLL